MKYYAIKVGRKTGIFTDWDECQSLVKGFKGALYKSFKNEEDAKAYLNDDTTSNDMPKQQKTLSLTHPNIPLEHMPLLTVPLTKRQIRMATVDFFVSQTKKKSFCKVVAMT